VEIPWHAYGTNTERGWDGSNDLKIGVAAVAEFGFLFGLSPRVDLTLGVSADYGFLNIKDRNDNLLGPVAGKTQQEQTGEVKPAMNDFYIGVLNSNRIEHINPMSIRGKVGLRIKIGKLKVKDTITETERRGGRTTGIGNDTIFVSPVIVYLPAQIPEQAGDGNGDPNGTNSGTSPSRNAYTQDTEPLPQEIEDELEESIYFDLDKSFLRPESKEVLDRKVELMKKYPQAVLSVVGHTCNLGTEGHNDRLSYDRAEEARMYLIEKGVHPSRIVPIPRGMKNPKYKNIDESNRALNRRVDFLIAR
ncbi:MAG: OmpA family protein, partial [Lentimicrobiaceae bacterium]|nr:OmpA family protein [Lentimicrobiaceae bacterium]